MAAEATVGIETEFFIVNSEGKMVDEADKAIRSAAGVENDAREEIGLAMLETGAPPATSVEGLFAKYAKGMLPIMDAVESESLHLLQFGCHPAKSDTKMREKEWYRILGMILGKKKIEYVKKVCGFHFHYSLPSGILEKETQKIKRVSKSRGKDTFLGITNFSIAAEPACTCFCQSSPFLDGKYYGKDSRTLIWRDMEIEGLIEGVYHNFPLLGGLPHYEFTVEDLRSMYGQRKELYLDLMREKNLQTNELVTATELKFMWGPLRVNKIGTLEFRGFDTNYPSIMKATAKVLETALKGIERKGLQVLPSDIGINEPFAIEDGTVYLPPFSIVKSMELLSARYGFDNSSVRTYCSAFVNFAKKVGRGSGKEIAMLQSMVRRKETMSDQIIALVRKNGHDENAEVPNEVLQYVAAYHSKRLRADMESVLKSLKA